MVSTMLANNEVGTVEPVEELVCIAYAPACPSIVDAVQAAGQIPICFRDWGVDALSVSGHKFGTPKGLERCWYAAAQSYEPVLSGGGQVRACPFWHAERGRCRGAPPWTQSNRMRALQAAVP